MMTSGIDRRVKVGPCKSKNAVGSGKSQAVVAGCMRVDAEVVMMDGLFPTDNQICDLFVVFSLQAELVLGQLTQARCKFVKVS